MNREPGGAAPRGQGGAARSVSHPGMPAGGAGMPVASTAPSGRRSDDAASDAGEPAGSAGRPDTGGPPPDIAQRLLGQGHALSRREVSA